MYSDDRIFLLLAVRSNSELVMLGWEGHICNVDSVMYPKPNKKNRRYCTGTVTDKINGRHGSRKKGRCMVEIKEQVEILDHERKEKHQICFAPVNTASLNDFGRLERQNCTCNAIGFRFLLS